MALKAMDAFESICYIIALYLVLKKNPLIVLIWKMLEKLRQLLDSRMQFSLDFRVDIDTESTSESTWNLNCVNMTLTPSMEASVQKKWGAKLGSFTV